jgi:putative peptidoglycan lipid II flippase
LTGTDQRELSSEQKSKNNGKSIELEEHRLAKSASIVSIAVMGSRILGLIREQVFAAYFGAGFLKDAFTVGFRIPNLLRDLFAEGALSMAFVKTFTDYIEKRQDEEAAWRLASMVMNVVAVVLSLLAIVGIIFSPQLVSFIAHGFSPEKAELAVTLTRIMFPFIVLVAIAAVAMGVLNTKEHFGIPASATTIFNLGSVIGGLILAYWLSGGEWTSNNDPNQIPDASSQWAIIGMAIGTLIGGSLQFLIQVPSLLKVGFRFRPVISFSDPGVRQIMRLMAPAIIGSAAVQVNVLINTSFATKIEGAPSWLDYAFRLMQFPIGIFGVAIGTASVPVISKFAARSDITSLRKTIASSMGLVFFLTIPSACGLIVLSHPIVAMIYQHGVFTIQDTEMVAAALAAYSIGLAGYAAIKVIIPAFYALDSTRIPMIVSIASVIVNSIANYLFLNLFSDIGVTANRLHGYGHVGLALSTSCVALINFFALILILRRRIDGIEGRAIFSSFIKIASASIVLSIVSYATYRWLWVMLGDSSLSARFIEVLIPIVTGGLSFLIMAKILHIQELYKTLEILITPFNQSKD